MTNQIETACIAVVSGCPECTTRRRHETCDEGCELVVVIGHGVFHGWERSAREQVGAA